MITASEAARVLGSIRTEKRAAASRENGKKGGKQVKRLEDIPFTCGGQEMVHLSTCRRGIAIRYRQKKGLPLT